MFEAPGITSSQTFICICSYFFLGDLPSQIFDFHFNTAVFVQKQSHTCTWEDVCNPLPTLLLPANAEEVERRPIAISHDLGIQFRAILGVWLS